jgi:alkanesulfonate monooxygenase SsuD/methylene tetrahydromethanopterin reductase-like flavin-dependent oxidoreductase (luciferase family)
LFTDPDKIHRINHDGTHYAVRGPLNAPRPLQGWPVIVMPAISTEAYDLASRVADLVVIEGATPDGARRVGDIIREKSVATGRDVRAVRILANVEPILRRTNTEADHATRFSGAPARVAALMREWCETGVCDGFNLVLRDLAALDLLGDCVTALARPSTARGGTLRERLDLPRPRSRYAA